MRKRYCHNLGDKIMNESKNERSNRNQADMKPVEKKHDFKVTLFRPEDADGVVRLFLKIYGKDYPIRTFIEPERLIKENASGKTISTVARNTDGKIVGHLAMFCSSPYERLYESGAGLVLPEYRGGAIMTAILTQQLSDARQFGIEIIFGEPVCNHIYMQKLCHHTGWTTCGVEVDLMPAEAYDAERSATGRVTTLIGFIFIKSRFQKIYLPEPYEDMFRFIYPEIKEEREIAVSSPDVELPAGTKTRMELQIFEFGHVARIAVHEVGPDFDSVLANTEKTAMEKGVIVFQLWSKLTWPWTSRLVEQLRSKGYFIGGALPRWFDDDGFLMQKILNVPNWEGIKIYEDRAGKILDYVRADWEGLQPS